MVEVHCKEEYAGEVDHNEVEVGRGEEELQEEKDKGHDEEAGDGYSDKDASVVHLGEREDEPACEQEPPMAVEAWLFLHSQILARRLVAKRRRFSSLHPRPTR